MCNTLAIRDLPKERQSEKIHNKERRRRLKGKGKKVQREGAKGTPQVHFCRKEQGKKKKNKEKKVAISPQAIAANALGRKKKHNKNPQQGGRKDQKFDPDFKKEKVKERS